MTRHLSLLLLLFITILHDTNGQWYIIKKDYPAHLMNYPNPGKRSVDEQDWSIPYPSLKSYEKDPLWLLTQKNKKSLLTQVDDSLSSSNSNSIEDELYTAPRLIPHERRTPRFIPPYFHEQADPFTIRLLQRLRRSTNKNK